MEIKQLDEKEYEQFVQNHPYGNFVQSSYNANIRKDLGYKIYLLGFYHENQLVGTAYGFIEVIHKMIKRLYIPRGYVIDYSNKDTIKEVTECITNFCKSEKIDYVKIDPYVIYETYDENEKPIINSIGENVYKELIELGYNHLGFNVDHSSLQPRFQYVLDINNRSYEELYNTYKPKTKNFIKACAKHNVRLVEGSIDDIDEFKKIMDNTSSRQGFHSRDKKYYELVMNEFGKGKAIKLLFAKINFGEYLSSINSQKAKYENDLDKAVTRKYPDNTIKEIDNNIKALNRRKKEAMALQEKYDVDAICAAAMFVMYGKEVNYFYSGADEDLLMFSGQYLIQNEMIKYSCDNHYERYNFLGFTGDFENDGVYQFKKKFPGHAESFVGEFDLPVNKAKYNLYKAIKKVKK